MQHVLSLGPPFERQHQQLADLGRPVDPLQVGAAGSSNQATMAAGRPWGSRRRGAGTARSPNAEAVARRQGACCRPPRPAECRRSRRGPRVLDPPSSSSSGASSSGAGWSSRPGDGLLVVVGDGGVGVGPALSIERTSTAPSLDGSPLAIEASASARVVRVVPSRRRRIR